MEPVGIGGEGKSMTLKPTWAFVEQEDKFGYLNNPNWTKDSKAVAFSEAVGNTVDREDDHKPCGHWHKDEPITEQVVYVPHCCYQCATIYMGGGLPFIPFVMWMDLTPYGMLSMVHDYSGRIFIENNGMIDYSDDAAWSLVQWDKVTEGSPFPAVDIINDTTWTWTSLDYTKGQPQNITNRNTSVWVSRNGNITKTAGLMQRIPLDVGGDWSGGRETRKTIIIKSNETIVVPDIAWRLVAGVGYQAVVMVAVSHDFGASWERILVHQPKGSNPLKAEIRKDSNGVLWILALENSPANAKLLYKSTDDGDTWELINTITLAVLPNYYRPSLYVDSTTIYIVDSSDPEAVPDLYKSTDGGENFSKQALSLFGLSFIDVVAFAARGDVMLIAVAETYSVRKIYRSANNGESWTEVQDMSPPDYSNGQLRLLFGDFTHDGNHWVFAGFEQHETDTNRLGYFYSSDNGATFSFVKSPISFTDDADAMIIQYTGGSAEDRGEPQVWGMN